MSLPMTRALVVAVGVALLRSGCHARPLAGVAEETAQAARPRQQRAARCQWWDVMCHVKVMKLAIKLEDQFGHLSASMGAAAAHASIPATRLPAAPVALSRGKVVKHDLTMPADFTLAFDIHPTGHEQNWASIVHYTDSDNSNRVPGIWFWPGTTKLHVVVGPNNHHINPDYSLPLNQWSSVRVQVAGATAKITINGRDFDYTGLPARPAVTVGVTLYAADPWYPAARASIRAGGDTIEVLSGPTAVALNRGQSPGREWMVRLGASQFKVSIEDSTGMTLSDVSARIERVPAMYRRAFEIVSETGKNGVAFYSDLGGAAGHGGQAYINLVPGVGADVITHEAGHAFEQRATSAEADIPQRWQDAIVADVVSVSAYGDGAWWEDEAEFAKVYAWCYDAGAAELAKLRSASPARFVLFERMLELSGALGFECSESANFITGVRYTQQSVCGSVDDVLERCEAECSRIGCTAFFYQEHSNDAGCPSSPHGGYQVCGYTTAATFGTTKHGHRAGSQVCRKL